MEIKWSQKAVIDPKKKRKKKRRQLLQDIPSICHWFILPAAKTLVNCSAYKARPKVDDMTQKQFLKLNCYIF